MPEIKSLIIGLTSIIDEPLFLSQRLAEKYDVRTMYLCEGIDRRIGSPNLAGVIHNLPLGKISLIRYLLKTLSTYKPDIIEQYLSTGSETRDFIYTVMSNLFRVKRIVNCIGGEILYWEKHSAFKKFTIKYALRTAQAYTCKEPYMKEMISHHKIAGLDKFHFIENAIDPDFYSLRFSDMKPQGKKVVLFYNSFKKWRNLDCLIAAANKITEQCDDIIFLIVGARTVEEYLYAKGFVRNDEQVKILFQSNDKELFYSLTDIFVLPADHVYLNVSLLEAMSLGIPCIVSDAPGVDRVIEHGRNGIVVKNRDMEALTAAITDLIDDNPKRKMLGSHAKETVVSRFNVEERARMHFNIYRQVLSLP